MTETPEFAQVPLDPEVEYTLLQSDFRDALVGQSEAVLGSAGTLLVRAGNVSSEEGKVSLVVLTEFTPSHQQQQPHTSATRTVKIFGARGIVRIVNMPLSLEVEDKADWDHSTAARFADLRQTIQSMSFDADMTNKFVDLFRSITNEPSIGGQR